MISISYFSCIQLFLIGDSSFSPALRDCIRNDRVFFKLGERREGSQQANLLSFLYDYLKPCHSER
jgi:hypothetical protein